VRGLAHVIFSGKRFINSLYDFPPEYMRKRIKLISASGVLSQIISDISRRPALPARGVLIFAAFNRQKRREPMSGFNGYARIGQYQYSRARATVIFVHSYDRSTASAVIY